MMCLSFALSMGASFGKRTNTDKQEDIQTRSHKLRNTRNRYIRNKYARIPTNPGSKQRIDKMRHQRLVRQNHRVNN